MARTKKIDDGKNENVKSNIEKVNQENSSEKFDQAINEIKKDLETKNQENDELKAKLLEMSELLAKLSQNTMGNKEPIQSGERQILVQSLCYGKLSLSTEKDGAGDIYTFDEFGETQSIPSSDLKKIVKNNKKFAKEGYFYIDDKDFVISEQLESSYKNLLDKDGFIKLLSENDVDAFEQVFKVLTEGQKRNIVNLMVKKVANDETINLSIVYKCGELYSEISKYNEYKGNYILTMAEQNKSLMIK